MKKHLYYIHIGRLELTIYCLADKCHWYIYNLFVTSKKRNQKFTNSRIKSAAKVFKMKKQDLKCFLKKEIRNNTPLKSDFKRLSGLYATL